MVKITRAKSIVTGIYSIFEVSDEVSYLGSFSMNDVEDFLLSENHDDVEKFVKLLLDFIYI